MTLTPRWVRLLDGRGGQLVVADLRLVQKQPEVASGHLDERSPSNIIALDENDAMAIVTRHMVENDANFNETRIRFSQSESLPKDAAELTTIGNLYDILKVVFSKLGFARRPADLRLIRPSDEDLNRYIALAKDCFCGLTKAFPSLAEYLRLVPRQLQR